MPGALLSGAGVLGVAGVGISAAASHMNGGPLAVTAGQFCLFHAAVVIGLAGLERHGPIRTAGVAGLILLIGTLLFSGDLALAGLAGLHPFPVLAPLGGTLLLLGWLLVVASGIATMGRRR